MKIILNFVISLLILVNIIMKSLKRNKLKTKTVVDIAVHPIFKIKHMHRITNSKDIFNDMFYSLNWSMTVINSEDEILKIDLNKKIRKCFRTQNKYRVYEVYLNYHNDAAYYSFEDPKERFVWVSFSHPYTDGSPRTISKVAHFCNIK
jgi:hypothetical protein